MWADRKGEGKYNEGKYNAKPTTIECFAPLNNKSLKISPKENLKIQRTEILKQKPFFTDEKIWRNRFWQNITM